VGDGERCHGGDRRKDGERERERELKNYRENVFCERAHRNKRVRVYTLSKKKKKKEKTRTYTRVSRNRREINHRDLFTRQRVMFVRAFKMKIRITV
jgi:hypothetical protein